ncbi:hypothetical protein ATANTOWER_013500 [Ataeniobius toweri]|uniref:Secreted protein n=1 Tax=Ataeniobius toweri TaxID=208326 RepID=A0ABU7B095_9TELE|nr:hypothetical protein [Ataeniobius toweri]
MQMCVCLYVTPISFLIAPESDCHGTQSSISPKTTQALPRCVGGTFTPSLSTLTSPGGRKNFAPACFSSARIRCAFNINPVYRSSGSAAAWIVVHLSGFGARLLLSFVLVETHTVICSRQAGSQTLSLLGHAEKASLVE